MPLDSDRIEVFAEALEAAALALEAFEQAVDSSAGAVSGGEDGGGAGGSGGFGTAGSVGSRKERSVLRRSSLGAAGFARAQAGNIAGQAVGADVGADDVTGIGSLAVLTGLNEAFPTLSALTGGARASRVLGGTQARVFGPLSDLARAGVVIPDEFLDRQVELVEAQEKRVEDFRSRVSGRVGGLGSIEEAAEGTPLVEVVGVLREILDTIKSLSPGGAA